MQSHYLLQQEKIQTMQRMEFVIIKRNVGIEKHVQKSVKKASIEQEKKNKLPTLNKNSERDGIKIMEEIINYLSKYAIFSRCQQKMNISNKAHDMTHEHVVCPNVFKIYIIHV